MEKEADMINSNTSESHTAMRSTKATLLLLSLKSRRQHQEKEIMNETIEELKMEVVKERYKRRKLELFSLLEFTLLILLFFSLLTFLILFTF